MERFSVSLTVYFDAPFWVGVFENVEDEKLQVYRVVFHSEPKNEEILQLIDINYHQFHFSEKHQVVMKERPVNPKRLQRDVKKQMQKHGISTKSQEVLKHHYEMLKQNSKKEKQDHIQQKREERFQQKQHQKKEKHRRH